MEREKTWDQILNAAGFAASVLGLPELAVAVALAKVAEAAGCAVIGCPADVDLKGPLPDVGRAWRDAEQAAEDRVRASKR